MLLKDPSKKTRRSFQIKKVISSIDRQRITKYEGIGTAKSSIWAGPLTGDPSPEYSMSTERTNGSRTLYRL